MKRDTYLLLRKIATDFGAGGYNPALQSDTYMPAGGNPISIPPLPSTTRDPSYKLGHEIPVANSVKEVLNANVANLDRWAKSPYARSFAVSTIPGMPQRVSGVLTGGRVVNGKRLPGIVGDTTGWMCLQGIGMCSPGNPVALNNRNGYDGYTTTSGLNYAINNNTRVPINPNFNLYVLTDKAARDIDYRLPGAWHVAEYPDGSGHAVMGAPEKHVYDFNYPGLVLRPESQEWDFPLHPRYKSWWRKADWGSDMVKYPLGYYDTDTGTPEFRNVRTMMAMPTGISPDQVAGQFYDLLTTREDFKDQKGIIPRDEYIRMFQEANRNRVDGGHFMVPTFIQNSPELPSYPTDIDQKQLAANIRLEKVWNSATRLQHSPAELASELRTFTNPTELGIFMRKYPQIIRLFPVLDRIYRDPNYWKD